MPLGCRIHAFVAPLMRTVPQVLSWYCSALKMLLQPLSDGVIDARASLTLSSAVHDACAH